MARISEEAADHEEPVDDLHNIEIGILALDGEAKSAQNDTVIMQRQGFSGAFEAPRQISTELKSPSPLNGAAVGMADLDLSKCFSAVDSVKEGSKRTSFIGEGQT